jgi:hypothetical protein
MKMPGNTTNPNSSGGEQIFIPGETGAIEENNELSPKRRRGKDAEITYGTTKAQLLLLDSFKLVEMQGQLMNQLLTKREDVTVSVR